VLALMLAAAPAAGALAQTPEEAALIAQSGFPTDNLGYLVVELETGKVRRELRAGEAFIPASMVKLMTAYAALETLGPDYRFETPVLAQSAADGLNLHFSGGGDPVLVQEDLAALAWTLKQNVGVRPVARFTYDSDALPFIAAIDPSDDAANSYNPPVAALSVNFNRQWLKWERQPDTRAMLVQVLPDLGHAVPGVAPVRAVDGRPVQVLSGHVTRLLIEPQVPSAGSRRIAVHAPAFRTALMLRRFAEQSGLALPLPVPAPRPGSATVSIASVESRPMLEIAEALLEYSNNLSAELVGLAVAKKLGHAPGSLRESALAVRQWVSGPIPTLAGKNMVWTNQSGLSGEGRLSPRALYSLLWHARGRTYGDRSFLDLLHEPRWSERDPKILVRAKSGTMSYARGQAGLLQTKDGRRFLFVLMNTDFAARAAFEISPDRFSNPVRRAAGRWGWRARELERSLILHWTETL
jgi:D-alanyl-D-alanine carboxypeptidase/D-alanyl-D-alanine-endopeptidase (penicillin-binding protein 4)